MISTVEGIYYLTALIAIISAFVFWVKAMNRAKSDEAHFPTKIRFFVKREHFTPEGYKHIIIAGILLIYATVPQLIFRLFIHNPF